ncbi:MAG: type II toxin-antitoxin system mRNA interferase toxin, RelE/StbE family [Nitrospira sp.]|nr:type II toxin-antitoxin system mRNA interferase toxin, RelE/StbE family [Nitrospira sp.]
MGYILYGIVRSSMWEFYEHRRASRSLDRLPVELLKRYEKWKDIVQISGPAGLRLIKEFHDERLQGEWEGHRSSRLNVQYRVIYKVEAQRILVVVMDVTAHDYRRQ